MKGIPQGSYTKEFREEAMKMVTEVRMSLPEAAQRLSLPPSTLGNRVKANKAGKLGEIGKTQRPLTEIETRMERDLLKKAAAYFAKESLPGTR